MKRIFIIALSLFLMLSPLSASASSNTDISNELLNDDTVIGYLISDNGDIIEVPGYKVEPISTLSYGDTTNTVTYEYTLYSNSRYQILSPEKEHWDDTGAVKIYNTISYETTGTPSKCRLNSVSGHWEPHDLNVVVTNANITYGCCDYSITQSNTISNVPNGYYYATGFTNYVLESNATIGADLTLTMQMGSQRIWTFVSTHKYMSNSEIPLTGRT